MIRSHFNSITQILDSNGTPATDRSAIEQVFLNFYSNLWSNPSNISFADILRALPSDLPRLLIWKVWILYMKLLWRKCLVLCKSCPQVNPLVLMALMLNFFVFFWLNISDHLFSIVSQFFSNSIMPKSWGKTYIILIHKKDNLHLVSDYRSISLCNVCFKIISKILAN